MRKIVASVVAMATMAMSRLVVYGPQELKDKFEYSGKQHLVVLIDCRVQDPRQFCKLWKHSLWLIYGMSLVYLFKYSFIL
jgi:hypothetical protein